MTDTFLRSCEHWSEASRKEMEAFYTLASIDYKYLAETFDWKKWLEKHQTKVGKRSLKILDVACGSDHSVCLVMRGPAPRRVRGRQSRVRLADAGAHRRILAKRHRPNASRTGRGFLLPRPGPLRLAWMGHVGHDMAVQQGACARRATTPAARGSAAESVGA